MPEVIDLNDMGQELTITLERGASCAGDTTNYYILPPLTSEEEETIANAVDPYSQFGEPLECIGETPEGTWFVMYQSPKEEHVALGVELAEKTIALKGLRAAHLKIQINERARTYIVLSDNGE